MKVRLYVSAATVLFVAAGVATVAGAAWQQAKKKVRTAGVGYSDGPMLPGQKWRVHDIARPQPKVISPAAQPGGPPSDAVILFDGKDLSKWTGRRWKNRQQYDAPPAWKVEDGYMEIVGGTGPLISKEKFGDCQIHLEWAALPGDESTSQWRGNSGVMIMGRYEMQILDSWNNPTYADGGAGSVYGQWPAMVNPSRKPGEWQVFDIVFEAPRFEGEKVAKPAFVTIFFNGALVHHRQEIIGRVAHRKVGVYFSHAPEEPLELQDHDVPVRFRNIWVRRLAGYDQP